MAAVAGIMGQELLGAQPAWCAATTCVNTTVGRLQTRTTALHHLGHNDALLSLHCRTCHMRSRDKCLHDWMLDRIAWG